VHEGLGNSSYLVGLGNGNALLFDPDRTAARYFRAAEDRGWRITAAFETHIHADFITGAPEVICQTSAPVYTSDGAAMAYAHRGLSHGHRTRVDGAEIEVIASPGHTPEHVSYVLRTAGGPPALFSGGALTPGAAARTDLLSPDLTEPLTRAQFRTLHNAFKTLPDETLLFPTHGSGSFCTAGAAGTRTSTLGRERATNPLLSFTDEDEFARWFPATFPAVPAYFAHMRHANQAGPRLRKDIPMPPPLAPEEFQQAARDALIVDVRHVDEYARGHIPGSLSNALRPSYATWLGWLVPLGTPLLFVLPGPRLLDTVIDESLLIGQERFAGWLQGGIQTWAQAGLPLRPLAAIGPGAAQGLVREGAALLDVREAGEYASGHIPGAVHVPLGELQSQLDRVPRDRPLIAYCGHGERSASASSILERAGYQQVHNLAGGMDAWRASGQRVAV